MTHRSIRAVVRPFPGLLAAAVVALVAGIAAPPARAGMTVEQAYAAIPHRRTAFDASRSTLPAADKAFLQKMFEAVDRAVVMRVESLAHVRSNGSKGSWSAGAGSAARALERLRPPEHLAEAHGLIVDAVDEQRRYLEEWKRALDRGETYAHALGKGRRHDLVTSSSQKLIKAYGLIKGRYPDEEAKNVQAFFDHLCALDFV